MVQHHERKISLPVLSITENYLSFLEQQVKILVDTNISGEGHALELIYEMSVNIYTLITEIRILHGVIYNTDRVIFTDDNNQQHMGIDFRKTNEIHAKAVEAIREFCRRVDAKVVKSTYTYNKFKDILKELDKKEEPH